MKKTQYNKQFYSVREKAAVQSAEQVVPIVLEHLKPSCIIDIGCGNGCWLSAFAKQGVNDYMGVDGGAVDSENLLISPEHFSSADLSKETYTPGRRYDLVVSLEVAEHIPEDKADSFIEMLTGLGDTVLFSAAIPGQGGVGHVNEQWQSYWAAKFKSAGYEALDIVRPLIWENPKVSYWYKQNILVYSKNPDNIDKSPPPVGFESNTPGYVFEYYQLVGG